MPQPSARHSGLTWGLAIGAVCTFAVAAYVKNVVPNISPRNFGVVQEGRLYRSGALTPAATRRVVQEHGIRTIVDLGGFDKDPVGDRIAARTASALGVERHVFLLEGDGTGDPNAYVEALRVIADSSKQPVLVHCSAGAQRTSGCVMLYRDLVQGLPLDQTYPEALEFRHDPKDNPRLMPFLKKWRQQIGDAFRSGGRIPEPAPHGADGQAEAAGAR